MKNATIIKREYRCGSCGGPVTKPACPTATGKGLGHWKCVNRHCTRLATSINKAGALNQFTRDDGKTYTDMNAVNTGQSPKARVLVRLVKVEA